MAKNDKFKKSDLKAEPRKSSGGRSVIKPLSVLAVLVVAALSLAFFLTHRDEQAASPQENPAPTYSSKPVITSDGWIRGSPSAKTILVEFGDFQTPLELALSITAFLADSGEKPDIIIEPTCGRGNFITAATENFPQVRTAYGFDINANHIREAGNSVRHQT